MFWDYQGSVETDYFIGFGMHKFVVAELVIFFFKKKRICASKRKSRKDVLNCYIRQDLIQNLSKHSMVSCILFDIIFLYFLILPYRLV